MGNAVASKGYTISGSGSNGLTLNGGSGTPAEIIETQGTHAISALMEIAGGGGLAIVLSGSGILQVPANISDDNASESLTLSGDGGGKLILGGSNSYGGGTTINAGIVQAGNNSALGAGCGLDSQWRKIRRTRLQRERGPTQWDGHYR